ncbi:hypothetical protein ACSSS7_007883 [Eimeria intestinalis]
MKLNTTLPAAAAALAVLFAPPSSAVRLTGMKEQQHLQPASFAAIQSEAEALQLIKNQLAAVDDEDASDSQVQQKLLKAVAPALKTLFESAAKAVKPQLKEECDRLIAELTQVASDEMEADWSADAFSELSAEAELEGQQQERLTVEGFWATVKKHVGTLASVAAPLLETVAKKLGPTVEKLGSKIAPTFARYIKLLMRKACEQAEKDAGVSIEDSADI